MIGDYIRLARPKHWIKNFFVLAPLVFARLFADLPLIGRSLLAFVSFCLAASSIYILNDVVDRKRDAAHPTKRNRPIASGRIPPARAAVFGALLLLASLALAYPLGLSVVHIVAAYMALNVAYTLFLNRLVVLDVMVIALGFLLRLQAGAIVAEVALSRWILVTTFFLALFLGYGKRRKELVLVENGDAGTDRTRGYSSKLLDFFVSISAGLTVISYSLYTIDVSTVDKMGTDRLIYTVPIVVYGLFRYLAIIYRKGVDGDPTESLLGDPGLIISVLLWLAISIVMII